MKFPIEQKIVAGFGVAILVLLLIAAATIWNGHRFETTFHQVEHTHRVRSHLETIAAGVLGMQSNTRGYLLTGSDELLQAFEYRGASVATSMAELTGLIADNPHQVRAIAELRRALDHAADLMRRRIAERQASGHAPVIEPAPRLEGQRAVEQVQAIVREMESEEIRLLGARGARTIAAGRSTIDAAIVGCALAIAFLVASGLMVRRDFHQRQIAGQSLRKSQQMFQRVFDNAPDAIIQVDRAGVIVRANRQADALFGWSPGELAGRRIEQLLPQRFHARHGGHLATYFAAPRPRAMGAGLELFGRRKDEREFPVDIMLSPIDTDEGQQALAVVRDITERKSAEERIRRLNIDLQIQNARLEIANKELESFSYSVSHDLRAPLRHIDGFASLLAKHASGALDEKSRRFLIVISDSARRMGRLIDDLLTFSRMGRTQIDLANIDHDALVAGVVREATMNRAGSVEWRIAPLPRVQADSAMLRQVWFNLVDNALKYSARAAHPRIEIGGVPPEPDATEHIFFVRDNGVGFEMKYAAKLFGVFQRLHSEAEFEGTGIGLANVRRIITRHGGRTWAESQAGAGATFFFSLPIVPDKPDPLAFPATRSPFKSS